eukprot:scaffold797_cov236-Pinguiococcus_pyrenoidosus.AAC.2
MRGRARCWKSPCGPSMRRRWKPRGKERQKDRQRGSPGPDPNAEQTVRDGSGLGTYPSRVSPSESPTTLL